MITHQTLYNMRTKTLQREACYLAIAARCYADDLGKATWHARLLQQKSAEAYAHIRARIGITNGDVKKGATA